MSQSIFLTLPGIEGEATTKGHEKTIEVLAYGNGVIREHTAQYGGGSGAGKVNFQDITIHKYVDASSPKLFQNCCNGKHFDTGTTFVFSETGGENPVDFLTIKFKEVTITSISHNAAHEGEKVMENVTLSYVEMVMEYLPQTTKGEKGSKTAGGWNTKTASNAA